MCSFGRWLIEWDSSETKGLFVQLQAQVQSVSVLLDGSVMCAASWDGAHFIAGGQPLAAYVSGLCAANGTSQSTPFFS